MCHAKVTRTPKNGDGNLEYMTKSGEWTADQRRAYKISEEDAAVFVRTLTKSTRGNSDGHIYDSTTVDD